MVDMAAIITKIGLIDHHCHGVAVSDLDGHEFESLLTEASGPTPLGGSLFDSRIGLALRRWCPPLLDLPAHATVEDYLARRRELGGHEVARRFLHASGVTEFLVDTGIREPTSADEARTARRTAEPRWVGLERPAELAHLAVGSAGTARAHEIVRLERVAEDVAARGVSASGFAEAVTQELGRRCRDAAGVKSIAAYRGGLELAGERPAAPEVAAAAGRFLAATAGHPLPRLAEPVLHRFLLWAGVDVGLPVQIHVGYGDSDLDLRRSDPLLLTDFLRRSESHGVPVILLHNYPYQRHAGYLAQVFSHVFLDIGLAAHGVGDRAGTVLAEALELAPFGKLLFSSDAYGLAEFYYLAAVLFTRGLAELLDSGVVGGSWTEADAIRLAGLVRAGNARRVYRVLG